MVHLKKKLFKSDEIILWTEAVMVVTVVSKLVITVVGLIPRSALFNLLN